MKQKKEQRKIDKICEKKGKFTREIWFMPGYDKRSTDPKKNCGWHGMDVVFVLKKGNTKAVTFRVFSNWHWKEEFYKPFGNYCSKPMGASIDLHTRKPQYEGQKKYGHHCDFLNTDCYCDGSCLQGDECFKLLCEFGLDALWKKMEAWMNVHE